MRIECIREKFADVIGKAEKVSVKNPSLPVLSCVLLVGEKGQLNVRATNLEVGIELSIPAKTYDEGTIAVPASILSRFLNSIQSEKNLKIESSHGNLVVSGEKNSTVIKGLAQADFPGIPEVGLENLFTLSVKDWVNGLHSVVFSASTSNIKPELSSVYVYKDNEDLVFVSSDSFRLAEKRIKVGKNVDVPKFLVPQKSALEMIRILDGLGGEVEIGIEKNHISLIADGVKFVSRLTDGNFPDYKPLIPSSFLTEVQVLKADFQNALRVSNVFSGSFNQIGFFISPIEKKMEISSKNNDVGETSQNIGVTSKGEEISILFNEKYISDVLNFIVGESIMLGLNGPGKPLYLSGTNDKTFRYIVMPNR